LLNGKANLAITKCRKRDSSTTLNPVWSDILPKTISEPTVLMLALFQASKICSTRISFSETNGFDCKLNRSISCLPKYHSFCMPCSSKALPMLLATVYLLLAFDIICTEVLPDFFSFFLKTSQKIVMGDSFSKPNSIISRVTGLIFKKCGKQ